MKAEIIAIGSELLSPDRLDTNSLYLTEKLNEAGLEVRLKTVVGDNTEDIEKLLRVALQRSRLIVLCGGLGPTEDDLTRAATAKALGRPLAPNEVILDGLRRRFALRGYRMAKINERQAEVIEGAEILDNPVGTAPGMWIEEKGASIVLLPGPPRELQAMFESQVLPRALKIGSARRLEKRTFGLQGLPESEVDSRIAPIYKSYPQIQTTILAAKGCISVRLQKWRAHGVDASDLEELAHRIRSELGDIVFTAAEETLEAVVGQMLRHSGRTLAVAESCTAGLIGSTITRVPGSSDYFRGGIICYSNELKEELCRVPRELLQRHGAVSAEVAEALARGARVAAHSSIGLSVTGIAGPDGGSEHKPVGLVYFGLADAARCIHIRRIFPGDRDTVRELATTFALGHLRRFLMPAETTA
ncbi:MAG: competence/damage-inducible protein A [Acidobacteriia bacterium]|nr:competence/damage-inducible protein A [Terriglobia bacterium]